VTDTVDCIQTPLPMGISGDFVDSKVKMLHKIFVDYSIYFGYFSDCKDWLRPVRLVFSQSSDFKNCQRLKTRPLLRSLPVLRICGPSVVWSWSGLSFFPVLGLDF